MANADIIDRSVIRLPFAIGLDTGSSNATIIHMGGAMTGRRWDRIYVLPAAGLRNELEVGFWRDWAYNVLPTKLRDANPDGVVYL